MTIAEMLKRMENLIKIYYDADNPRVRMAFPLHAHNLISEFEKSIRAECAQHEVKRLLEG